MQPTRLCYAPTLAPYSSLPFHSSSLIPTVPPNSCHLFNLNARLFLQTSIKAGQYLSCTSTSQGIECFPPYSACNWSSATVSAMSFLPWSDEPATTILARVAGSQNRRTRERNMLSAQGALAMIPRPSRSSQQEREGVGCRVSTPCLNFRMARADELTGITGLKHRYPLFGQPDGRRMFPLTTEIDEEGRLPERKSTVCCLRNRLPEYRQ